jgi:hypothetical protein
MSGGSFLVLRTSQCQARQPRCRFAGFASTVLRKVGWRMGGAHQTILSVYWCGDWRTGNFLSNDALVSIKWNSSRMAANADKPPGIEFADFPEARFVDIFRPVDEAPSH